ncbi:LLM class flavin-dependent oxidoreductase [Nonomuraea thailandensis]|uniref:LLM class flavin-dependent oxidoreductase n=1 Tax=Nonomuraea thailandensis TaxID=1188745 RepID=UPI0031E9FE25
MTACAGPHRPAPSLPARSQPPWNSASCPCPICKTDPAAGTLHDPARRTREIVSYAIAADQAGLDAFTLFGIDPADYDEVFAEKLDLLLAIRDSEYVTWSGRHRPALNHLPVPSRPQQARLPLWLGGKASRDARADLFPFYREYLRPKTPGGRGWLVSAEQYQALSGPFGALMTGSPQEVIAKILTERELFGIDRFMGQVDFGGMPAPMVGDSLELLATEVAPAIRKELGLPPGPA